MIQLPRWVLTNKQPAFYDTESVTSVQMVAKLYGTMQTLIDEYNKFAENTEKTVNDFMSDESANRQVFEIAMRQEFQDFIDVIDLRMQAAENFMRDNIETTVIKLVENGDITMTANYDDVTESLNFILTT